LSKAVVELEKVKEEIKIEIDIITQNSSYKKDEKFSNLNEFASNNIYFAANNNREALNSLLSLTSVKLNLLKSCFKWADDYVNQLI
jgi:hypothetical protein